MARLREDHNCFSSQRANLTMKTALRRRSRPPLRSGYEPRSLRQVQCSRFGGVPKKVASK